MPIRAYAKYFYQLCEFRFIIKDSSKAAVLLFPKMDYENLVILKHSLLYVYNLVLFVFISIAFLRLVNVGQCF